MQGEATRNWRAGREGRSSSQTPGPLRAGTQTSSSTATRQEAGPSPALLSPPRDAVFSRIRTRGSGRASEAALPGWRSQAVGGACQEGTWASPSGSSGLRPPLCWQPGGGSPGPKATVPGLLLHPPCLGPRAHPEEPAAVKTARPRTGRAGTLTPWGRRRERSLPGPRCCTRRLPPYPSPRQPSGEAPSPHPPRCKSISKHQPRQAAADHTRQSLARASLPSSPELRARLPSPESWWRRSGSRCGPRFPSWACRCGRGRRRGRGWPQGRARAG